MNSSKKVVCPNCTAVNRIPAERLSDKPLCGKCGKSIFTSKPIELTSENFHKHISNSEIPVVVDFWAPWCGPCKMIGPVIDQVSAELDGQAKVGKVNVDEARDLAVKYNVRSIPLLLFFKNGEVKDQIVGASVTKDQLKAKLEALA